MSIFVSYEQNCCTESIKTICLFRVLKAYFIVTYVIKDTGLVLLGCVGLEELN